MLTIVNQFTVCTLCWCSERFYVPSLLMWTFCGWQNVSSAHGSAFAVPGRMRRVCGHPCSGESSAAAAGCQNWSSSLNFSGLELILEAFCVSCWEYTISIFNSDWSESCHLSFALWSEITLEQHRAFASAVWSVHRLICVCHPCHQTAEKWFKEPKLPQASEPGPTPLQRTKADPCPKSSSVVLGRSSPVWLEQFSPSSRFLFTRRAENLSANTSWYLWAYLYIKSYLKARAMYQSKW